MGKDGLRKNRAQVCAEGAHPNAEHEHESASGEQDYTESLGSRASLTGIFRIELKGDLHEKNIITAIYCNRIRCRSIG